MILYVGNGAAGAKAQEFLGDSSARLKLWLFKTGRVGVYGLPPKPQEQRRGVDGAPGILAGVADSEVVSFQSPIYETCSREACPPGLFSQNLTKPSTRKRPGREALHRMQGVL